MPKMFASCTIHREIVEKDLHKGRYVFTENLRDDALKGWRRGVEPEHHHDCYKYTLVYYERHLLPIIQMDANMVVATKAI